MEEYNKQDVITSLKCKSIEAKYILSLLNKGISKRYLFENYIYNYQKNIDVMKNNKIFLEDYFKDYHESESQSKSRQRFEKFNDDCAKTLIKQKSKKLIRTISSHKKIFNEDTYKYFHTLAELNVTVDFIKKNIAKKIVQFTTTDDLNDALLKNINTFSDWDLNSKLKLINQNYVNIISTQNNKIIFEINDFESSKDLGSPIWCISRDEDDFENYRKNSDRIVFCYDFNKEPSDNENKTAYIINAQGHVTSGYFNDDCFMDKKDYNKYEEYFDKYTESEFVNRLEEKNYRNEYITLLLIANEFEDNIEYYLENCNFDNLNEQSEDENFSNFLNKNNEKAIFKMINEYTHIFTKLSSEGKLLSSLVNYAEYINYSDLGSDIITDVIKNNDLMDCIFKNKLDYSKYPLNSISLSNKDSDIQFKSLLNNKNYDLRAEINSYEHFHFDKKIFNLLNSVEDKTQIREYIKLNPKIVVNIVKSQFTNEAFNYLQLDKENDKQLISIIKKEVLNNDDYKNSRTYNIKKHIAEITEDENAINNVLKESIINRPRNLFSKRKDIENNNIKFTKEETLDICCGLIFENNFEKTKKLDIIYKYEDLLMFSLPEPIFGSSSLNLEGISEFVDFIQDKNIINQCKNELEVDKIKNKIELIEQHSPISFLINKQKISKPKIKIKRDI
jgi:hypothetical protein